MAPYLKNVKRVLFKPKHILKSVQMIALLCALLCFAGLNKGHSQSSTGISGFADASSLIPDLPQVSDGAVAWGDYDSDGRLDVLITGDAGSGFISKLYRNTGSGFADASSQIPELPQVSDGAVAWGDYDSDGRPDLIYTGFTASAQYITKLYHNNGGIFQDQSDLLPSLPHVSSGSVAWADFDTDGKLDLMLTGNTNTTTYAAKLYHNTGTGFEDASSLIPDLPEVGLSALAWADYDGDGRPDLLITGESVKGPISKLYRNTGGGFEDQSTLIPNLTGIIGGSVAWGDYDGDGRPDLLMTGIAAGNLYSLKFYHNTANGFVDITRSLPNIGEVATGSVAWIDFDRDNRLDMMITGALGDETLSILYHNTGSGFEDKSSLLPNLLGVAFSSLAWGDYDGDDWPDLLLTGFTGEKYVGKLYHNPGQDATASLPGLPQLTNSSVAWGDYDSDGKLDLMVTGATDLTHGASKLYHNTASGFVDASSQLPKLPQVGYSSVAWGDYDNDGRLDLMLTGATNGFNAVSKLYHNTANGFVDVSALLPSLPQVQFSAVAWGDYNNDGRPDLIITGQNGSKKFSKLYRNTGNGFDDASALLPHLPQVGYSSVAWGDYDKDGWLDLVITGRTRSADSSKLYHNIGGEFIDASGQLPNLPQVSSGAVAWGDYDADGRLDLLITGYTSGNQISKLYHQTASGFEDQSGQLPGLPQIGYSSAAWADVDNNGHADLLLTGLAASGAVSRLYLNNGVGFKETSSLLPKLTSVSLGSVAWGDYDNDGRLDLLLTGSSSDGYRSRLYHNLLSPANTSPTTPIELASLADPNGLGVLLSWQQATDSQTPAPGLSYNLYVSRNPGGQNTVGPMADQSTGYRRVVRLGNAQDTSYLLTGLTPGKTYYWSVQTIDGAFAGSPFAPEQSFVAGSLSEAETSVSSFTLVNAATDKDIRALRNGDVLDLTQLPRAGLNIRALATPSKVGSVVFELSGQQSRKHTENGAPYALFKNIQGNYFGGSLQPGEYTLTATPYGKADGRGAKGEPLTIHFKILYPAAVTTFTLVNALTGKDIGELKEGDVLNLCTLPTGELSVRANTAPGAVGSVALALSGAQSHSQTENLLPYSLYGDNVKTYNPWAFETGSYTLSATPYSAPRSGGAKGIGYTIHFTVMNNAESVTTAVKPWLGITGIVGEKPKASLSAAPNPFSSQTTVRFSVPTAGYAALSLYDASGKEVRRLYQGQAEGGKQYQVNLESKAMPAGIYTLRLTAGTYTTTFKVVATQ